LAVLRLAAALLAAVALLVGERRVVRRTVVRVGPVVRGARRLGTWRRGTDLVPG
jgi:hypothetical protein